MVEDLIMALAFAGFCISLYFRLVCYQLLQPNSRWFPAFCRMSDATCSLNPDEATLLGVPILGVMYYSALLLTCIPRFEVLFLLAFVFSVGLGMYLTRALVVRLRTRCVLCLIVHGINLLTANLLIVRTYQV